MLRGGHTLGGYAFHPLDSADQFVLLCNKFLDLIEGVQSIADLLDHTWAHSERLSQVSHHFEVVGFIGDHGAFRGCCRKIFLTLKKPVLAASVEPADVWDPATHLTCVVAMQSIHGDVSALSAAWYKAMGDSFGSSSHLGRWRWRWNNLRTCEQWTHSGRGECVEGVEEIHREKVVG